ncbi:hypothetical protein FN846DRAFT_922852 [Sphaerosporella brunnea]|uniref:Uncharacterized protein n=1 Tax=Sphaerosporella brunnea TaxID=1250544 RepID=A0A5J5EI51_9PEZI|nr:hypothetical protein FN846DRAFT_922852 [Sphaerosporella brunnea]
MDRITSLMGSQQAQPEPAPEPERPAPGLLSKFLGGGPEPEPEPKKPVGLLDKLHGALGGGPESEKKEDALDKGIDWVQEHILGQGPQDNENALEQAKDETISDFIRGQFKSTTGHEFPVADK